LLKNQKGNFQLTRPPTMFEGYAEMGLEC
jgi:hypothetical protein